MNVSLQSGWITAALELAEAIESGGGDVGELVARIEASEGGITGLGGRVGTAENDISTNTSDIATLTSDLSDLEARVAAIEDAAAA